METFIDRMKEAARLKREEEDRTRLIALQDEEIAYYKEQRAFLVEQRAATDTMKKATVAIAFIAGLQIAVLIVQIILALTTEPKAILIE